MRIHLIIFPFIVTTSLSCTQESGIAGSIQTKDTIPPVIIMYGEKTDTAYLNTVYKDPGSEAVDGLEGCLTVEITGKVNTAVPGTCYLDYDYTDAAGNIAATMTRTVHVMENSASFLNGPYNVVCTCTTMLGPAKPTVASDNYTAMVSSYPANNRFELVQLKIGPQYVIPITSLNGNLINVSSYRHGKSLGSGTLSPTKDTFIIESTFNETSPGITYVCRNVFTKSNLKEAIRKN